MSIDWGSVPDWLAGAGALAALYFARAAALSARASNAAQQIEIRELQDEQKERQAQERRAQASSVALWLSLYRRPREAGDLIGADTTALGVAARISNASNLPVYQLLVVASARGTVFSSRYSAIGPMTNRRDLDQIANSIQQAVAGQPLRDLAIADEMRIAASFRDAAGHWWCRTSTGELLEARDQEDAEERCRAGLVPNPRPDGLATTAALDEHSLDAPAPTQQHPGNADD